MTSFKEGSVRVQALVRLQAPTFLGQEGTKIEMGVTFQLQITTDSCENRWNVPLMNSTSETPSSLGQMSIGNDVVF